MLDKTLDRTKKAEFLFRQAKTYELQKDFATAREKYQTILKDFSDTQLSQPALFALGDSYYIEKQIDKALNYYQELLKSQAQNPQIVQLARGRIAAILRQQAGTRASTKPSSPTLVQQPAEEEE
jgi:TolA-binding protein